MSSQYIIPLAEWPEHLLNRNKYFPFADFDILDCMVVINFVAAPPTFNVKTVSDFLLTNDCEMRAGQQLHKDAKKNIECNLVGHERVVISWGIQHHIFWGLLNMS